MWWTVSENMDDVVLIWYLCDVVYVLMYTWYMWLYLCIYIIYIYMIFVWFSFKLIYFWLHWVCTSSSCSEQASHCIGFSCCREWALGHESFSSCGMWGLGAPWHVESSQTRGWTHVPCIAMRILNYLTMREVPCVDFYRDLRPTCRK